MFSNTLTPRKLIELRENLWDQFSYYENVSEASEQYKQIMSFNEAQLKMMKVYLTFLPPELLNPGPRFSMLLEYFTFTNYKRMAELNILKTADDVLNFLSVDRLFKNNLQVNERGLSHTLFDDKISLMDESQRQKAIKLMPLLESIFHPEKYSHRVQPEM